MASSNQPRKTYVLVPSERLEELENRACDTGLGPLTGPEYYPDPSPRPAPAYGPANQPQAAQPRGYFLDRYVY